MGKVLHQVPVLPFPFNVPTGCLGMNVPLLAPPEKKSPVAPLRDPNYGSISISRHTTESPTGRSATTSP
ncbi:serine O-acetyltransferase [Anopheles sinensis]|uniref:Serine O-acetyltransferase n=1 Tax=Anopheles sinensis TaxID=74873 RepID=A0A084VEP5_ANOSI|nr:serine O-acetyltransferase [Anopheles sinensis]